MPKTMAEIADDLAIWLSLGESRASAGCTPSGMFVDATMSDATIFFCHNLSTRAPTRAEALAIFAELKLWMEQLREASEAFDALCAPRGAWWELYVLSGQMDFTVAEWDGQGEVVWRSALD
jgi:hypothetical protein